MRRIKTSLAALSMATAAVFFAVPASPAHAYNTDLGDGDPACNQYEICFRMGDWWEWDDNGCYSRDFYYSSMHHGQEYFQYTCRLNDPTTFALMDLVNGVWNRDSTCDVKLWDYDANTGWYTYSDVQRGWEGDYGQLRNNGHSRC